MLARPDAADVICQGCAGHLQGAGGRLSDAHEVLLFLVSLVGLVSWPKTTEWPPAHPFDRTPRGKSAMEAEVQVQPRDPTTKGTPDRFIGDVWIDRLAGGEPGSRIRVNVVRFAPGARNAWHAHAVGQTIHVTEGIGRIQSRGSEALEIRA